MAKRSQKQATQVTLPPMSGDSSNTAPTEVEPADNENELSQEERDAAESSLDDDNPFSEEGGADIGDVDPLDEESPAYESEVVSDEDESEVVSDGDLDGEEINESTESPELLPVDPETESLHGHPNHSEPVDPEPIDQPPSDPNDLSSLSSPKPSRRAKKVQAAPALSTDQPSLQNVSLLKDGDIMDNTDSEAAAHPDSENLSNPNECLAWLEMNNLRASQQPSRVWFVYAPGSPEDTIIGAGASLPVACYAAGMRAAGDDDVENP